MVGGFFSLRGRAGAFATGWTSASSAPGVVFLFRIKWVGFWEVAQHRGTTHGTAVKTGSAGEVKSRDYQKDVTKVTVSAYRTPLVLARGQEPDFVFFLGQGVKNCSGKFQCVSDNIKKLSGMHLCT